jgi:hypothetical protein
MSAKPKEPTDKNSKLMRDCGADAPYQWEPEPTDHIRYAMNRGDWVAQVVGWVKWHTTRGSRSAWAMDDKGKLLTIKHASLDLGWNYQVTINHFYAAEAEGLIRIEKNSKKEPGRIGLCAKVPISGRTKGELNKLVQNQFPLELIENIEKLSAVERAAFENAYSQFQRWEKDTFDDMRTQTRRVHALVEDSILQAFGLARERKAREYHPKTDLRVDTSQVQKFVLDILQPIGQDVQDEAFCPKPKTVLSKMKTGAHTVLKEADTDTDKPVAIPTLVDNAAEGVQPVPIPGLVETPDALDSISKREIRTGQTGPHVSFENKTQERADTEAIERVSSFDLNGGETQFPERSARPPQNKAVKRTTEATIVRDSAASEKTQCQTKKRKHA